MTNLTPHVAAVAKARFTLDALNAAYKTKQSAFDAQTADLRAEIDDAKQAVQDAEEAARQAAIDAYTANPDGGKQPHDALGIRITTQYVYDADAAVGWALKHDMPALLKLNTGAFNKLVKTRAVDGLEITTQETVTATIASDLSAYLIEDATA